MKPYDQAQIRAQSYFPPEIAQHPFYGTAPQDQYYQGASQPYYGYPPSSSQTALSAPYSPTGQGTGLGSGSGFNFTQIKGMVDRLGGINGIMGHVTRIQKIIQSIQQMSPMLKVLMGSFGGKAQTTELNRISRQKSYRRRTAKRRPVRRISKRK